MGAGISTGGGRAVASMTSSEAPLDSRVLSLSFFEWGLEVLAGRIDPPPAPLLPKVFTEHCLAL